MDNDYICAFSLLQLLLLLQVFTDVPRREQTLPCSSPIRYADQSGDISAAQWKSSSSTPRSVEPERIGAVTAGWVTGHLGCGTSVGSGAGQMRSYVDYGGKAVHGG